MIGLPPRYEVERVVGDKHGIKGKQILLVVGLRRIVSGIENAFPVWFVKIIDLSCLIQCPGSHQLTGRWTSYQQVVFDLVPIRFIRPKSLEGHLVLTRKVINLTLLDVGVV